MINQKLADKRIKVLWLSNKVLSEKESSGTGTWLGALAHSLIQSGEIELGNLSLGKVSKLTRMDCNQVSQFVISFKFNHKNKNGLPSQSIVNEICRVVEDFAPDIIHIWGTEQSWGLLTARKIIRIPALLETQGLKFAIADVYDGGMTFIDKLYCIGLKEIVRGTTIFQEKKKFARWSSFEKEIISGHAYVTTQSPWLEAHVKAHNNTCKTFHNEFALQEPFYSSSSWQSKDNLNIFCSTSYPSPFKGLHVAIRAVAILKKRFPNIQMRIAGAHQKKGFRQDGFVKWLNSEARRLGVERNLFWLGPLTVHDIVWELENCSVCLLPTFIEGYCLALAEAMMVGTPTVVSFTGGTSYLAQDEETALFFSPGDEVMCANKVERILTDRDLVENISKKARQVASVRNNRDRIVDKQIDIYKKILELTKNNE